MAIGQRSPLKTSRQNPSASDQCERQPNLMKVPTNTPSDASKTHGLPCIIKMTPQLMKKVNSKKTRMAAKNFIGANCMVFSPSRNPVS